MGQVAQTATASGWELTCASATLLPPDEPDDPDDPEEPDDPDDPEEPDDPDDPDDGE